MPTLTVRSCADAGTTQAAISKERLSNVRRRFQLLALKASARCINFWQVLIIRRNAIYTKGAKPSLFSPPHETVPQRQKSVGAPLFVISSAARNLRSLTFFRDDNAAFGDCAAVSIG